MRRFKTQIKRQFSRNKRYVLVNKKTGKVSSSDNYVNRLTAIAVIEEDCSGIMGALPLRNVENLLHNNKLAEKKKRSHTKISVRAMIREEAQKMIIPLAIFYEKKCPGINPHVAKTFVNGLPKH